ncbi:MULTISPECIES: hypothetical protein [unclassified Pseudomonas]|uniref:hypothetical protein n=1 Tax=unclassified Pseudomonas TaxID=196821 RepID=UPI00119AC76B|nr:MULTISPECIES: hypothetical protein [unclassified Pseudomonas]TWC17619.1 hypothetical protein FBX99_117113 [Pseudomonas sp. SJZ074]TWC19747.1 hypothetical protein FBY00_105116 [Pseudomonas sp. SJZ075]TWC35353.1 hypothetical protein FBY02_105121 [Pseudomonas sp. SJZ078]TWC35471.1 hypothetical protein FBY06_1173 [Pseudomonas sp. SJZ085]TWC56299.1 hypothetical protein FBY11_105121 [Pseudomonas sp. SJZ124]
MSRAATKLDQEALASEVNFTANLEDNSNFNAAITTLKSSTTPNRGEVWVVVATEWKNGLPRTFTITFSKDIKEETDGVITDNDEHVSLIYNNYADPNSPTLQKARRGSIQYTMGADMRFTGSFTAYIDKAQGNDSYLCTGLFDTELSW